MKARVIHYSQVKADPLPDQEGVTVRWVIGKDHGAPHFAMRVFELQPGSSSPDHAHWWEHEVFILDGEGVLHAGQEETPLRPGMAVFVPGGLQHFFRNCGSQVLRFICLVPHPELEGWAKAAAAGSASPY